MKTVASKEESKKSTGQEGQSKSLTVMQRRWRKFKSLKRGYISLLILVIAYITSFFLPVLVNNKALIVHYEGSTYFPAVSDLFARFGASSFISGEQLGQAGNPGEAHYRLLQDQYEAEGGDNWVVMPLYPFGPIEDLNVDGNEVFMAPLTSKHDAPPRLLGTDNVGRDVFARMAYGFNISISFALIVAFVAYSIGIPFGAFSGYFGGWYDILLQRVVEIWLALPFLFLIIIIVALLEPSFALLVTLLAAFGWLQISLLMRAEFYREKSMDYVAAAISIGVPTHKILLKHILPNSLVPIITYLPFSIVLGISELVSLDFLGFGLPPPDPSWGQMVNVGLQNITTGYWWLVISPLSAMFGTLLLTVFIGEAIREAFDPKTFSRLR